MLVDLLLTGADDAQPVTGVYDETLAYTVLQGQPIVTFSAFPRTITDTRIGSEAPDTDAWATTSTSTKIRQEDVDRD